MTRQRNHGKPVIHYMKPGNGDSVYTREELEEMIGRNRKVEKEMPPLVPPTYTGKLKPNKRIGTKSSPIIPPPTEDALKPNIKVERQYYPFDQKLEQVLNGTPNRKKRKIPVGKVLSFAALVGVVYAVSHCDVIPDKYHSKLEQEVSYQK